MASKTWGQCSNVISACRRVYAEHQGVDMVSRCVGCGIELTGKKKKYTYCSNKCQQQVATEGKILLWKSGKLHLSQKTIRKYLLCKFKEKCSRCQWNGVNPYSGLSTLEVEHLDGNSDNNEESNLTLLCPNCHSLTPTFRALNRGSGRHSRRLRYKEGKSF
jgi:hypothetical protein